MQKNPEQCNLCRTCTTSEQRGSSMMFRVWMASGESEKMGNPAPSAAKSTSVPKG